MSEGEDDAELYREAVRLEGAWEASGQRDANTHIGHAAFCTLDWITQRMERTDQDNMTDILYFSWAAASDNPTSDDRREYWEQWLLDDLPSAFLACPSPS